MLSRQARPLLRRAAVHQNALQTLPVNLRGYAQAAAAAPATQDTKPPIALFGLDGTYASALVCQG